MIQVHDPHSESILIKAKYGILKTTGVSHRSPTVPVQNYFFFLIISSIIICLTEKKKSCFIFIFLHMCGLLKTGEFLSFVFRILKNK